MNSSQIRTRWMEWIPKSVSCLFKEPYQLSTFRHDLQAGITVGIIALPLAMAFAIASGVSPERGLFTAIIAGFLISLLGGSRLQIGGPTGAFVVIIYDIIQREGYGGLIAATLVAGILLVIMGLCRLGTLIKYIPYPLVTGFTTGIALLIFVSQIKDFLGLHMQQVPADFILKCGALFTALPTWNGITFSVSAGTLCLIMVIRRFMPNIPWGFASIALATLVCWIFKLPVETIATRYGEMPHGLPLPSLPDLPLTFAEWHRLFPDAITIAFLAGIESLLSAVVADGMSGRRHRSNCELVAQGLANLGSCFFGGIPATGAIARTAANVKLGAKTPVSGMIHAISLLFIMLTLAPIVSQIPMAALSAVLMMVAWNMSEAERFRHLFKAPLGDIALLLTAFALTVLVDLTVALEVGMILAAFLFMKRTSDLTAVVKWNKIIEQELDSEEQEPDLLRKKIPPGVEIYEINGPFFFGVAESLKTILPNLETPPKVFILRMRKVPAIDATGLHALDEFFHSCKRTDTILLLSGVKNKLAESFKQYGIEKKIGKQNIFPHIDAALQRANELYSFHLKLTQNG
jgi:SulP family sulfate permease